MNDYLTLALAADQESEKVEFKESLDTKSKTAWLEILKDIVAIANSGGGVLLIGVKDDGHVSGNDVNDLLNYDPADLTNKMFAYTGRHFSDFRITRVERDGQPVAAIEIGRVSVPLVFTTPGNYVGADGKQKNAFIAGAVYFRHGAKSEPATSDDLQQFIKREIDIVKESWLSGIRKVVEAPEGSKIMVLPPDAAISESKDLHGVRIVNDLDAPAVILREEDVLKNYPYDYRKLTQKLNERYTDFLENRRYHELRRPLESERRYCYKRLLNPDNERGGFKRFYSPAIIEEFDKYYRKR